MFDEKVLNDLDLFGFGISDLLRLYAGQLDPSGTGFTSPGSRPYLIRKFSEDDGKLKYALDIDVEGYKPDKLAVTLGPQYTPQTPPSLRVKGYKAKAGVDRGFFSQSFGPGLGKESFHMTFVMAPTVKVEGAEMNKAGDVLTVWLVQSHAEKQSKEIPILTPNDESPKVNPSS
jgi:hypothetical protein